jgi:hypothetical protein
VSVRFAIGVVAVAAAGLGAALFVLGPGGAGSKPGGSNGSERGDGAPSLPGEPSATAPSELDQAVAAAVKTASVAVAGADPASRPGQGAATAPGAGINRMTLAQTKLGAQMLERLRGVPEDEKSEREALRNMALHDPDPRARAWALSTLANAFYWKEGKPSVEYRDLALDCLRADADPVVRRFAVQAVGVRFAAQGDDLAFQAVQRAAQDDPDAGVRLAALESLRSSTASRAFAEWERALDQDPSLQVRIGLLDELRRELENGARAGRMPEAAGPSGVLALLERIMQKPSEKSPVRADAAQAAMLAAPPDQLERVRANAQALASSMKDAKLSRAIDDIYAKRTKK